MQNFNYHQHTFRCGHADLDMLDEDYVKEAIEAGLKKIAFTDHAPEKNKIDKSHNTRMEYEQKEEYLESIIKLKEKYQDKIEIETGFEVEYLPGEEDNILELKKASDKIILGQHFVYNDDKELLYVWEDNLTDRMIALYGEYVAKAMSLCIPDIIAHPDVYMVGRKQFGKKEEAVAHMICQVAEKYQIPLEINLNRIYQRTYFQNEKFDELSDNEKEERLVKVAYPCKGFWKIVANYRVKVLYGIDVHHRNQIPYFENLQKLATKILGKETIQKLKFIED